MDKNLFIKELAKYLVADQALKSIKLATQDKEALMWAKLRGTTPLFGYPTTEEAEKTLGEWLLGK